MNSTTKITAIGTFVPEKVMKNEDFQKFIETNDEWIRERTGIIERRVSGENEFTSDLAIEAVKDLSVKYNKDLSDVDFIIVGTSTPDCFFPSVASQIQSACNINQTGSLDISAACAGFTYGLILGDSLITSKICKKVLVVASETLTKSIDFKDRTTCILFGDGAAAALLEPNNDPDSGILASYFNTLGTYGNCLYRTAIADSSNRLGLIADGKVKQEGRKVFKWAVSEIPLAIMELLKKSGLALSDIDWLILHSANLRIIESICQTLNFPLEKTLYSIEKYGNTSTASIPLAIALALNDNKIKKGDKLLLYGFGGGLVHAGLIITWNLD